MDVNTEFEKLTLQDRLVAYVYHPFLNAGIEADIERVLDYDSAINGNFIMLGGSHQKNIDALNEFNVEEITGRPCTIGVVTGVWEEYPKKHFLVVPKWIIQCE